MKYSGWGSLMSRPEAGVVLGTLGVGRPSFLAEIKTYVFNLRTQHDLANVCKEIMCHSNIRNCATRTIL